MFYIMGNDGVIIAVPDVVSASVNGDKLVCMDREGHLIRSFDCASLTAFGHDNVLSTLFKMQEAEAEAGRPS